MDFIYEYSLIKDEIINVRRKLHQNPELSFEEYETAETISKVLDKYSVNHIKNIAKTGICATIGNPSSKNLLIRADIDALPTEEKTNLPFSSQKKGVMHACGHDMHASAALATAIILKKYEKELNGCVKIIFQPGEETTGGAEPMIESGILENPPITAAIGGHISPEFENKRFKVKCGGIMASPDDFCVKFIGKSSHGAEPHNGINPIEAACEFVTVIKDEMKKEIDFSKNVMTVCEFNAGFSYNIIPDMATVEGTFRSFSNEERDKANEILTKTASKICEKYGAKAEITYNYRYPPLINNKEICDFAISCAKDEFGEDKIKYFEKPLMTGEDFAYLAQEIPSVFIWSGCKDKNHECSLHSSKFVANEDAIENGARMFVKFAIEYVNQNF